MQQRSSPIVIKRLIANPQGSREVFRGFTPNPTRGSASGLRQAPGAWNPILQFGRCDVARLVHRGTRSLSADRRLYGPLKAQSEQEAQTQYGEATTTIIRAGLIVGPGDATDRFTYWPKRLARGGDVLAPGDGSDPVQFIDVRDLAEWTIRVAEQRITGVFNAAGPDPPITVGQMLAGIAQGLQVHPRLVWAPTAFLRENDVSPWGDMPVWIPGQGETFGFHRRDIRRAIVAGLTYRPLPITAADTLAWLRTLLPERQAKLRAGLIPGRETDLLTKLKA